MTGNHTGVITNDKEKNYTSLRIHLYLVMTGEKATLPQNNR